MAIISEDAVQELKNLYLEEYGVKLSTKEATELANLLLNLFGVLFTKAGDKLVKHVI